MTDTHRLPTAATCITDPRQVNRRGAAAARDHLPSQQTALLQQPAVLSRRLDPRGPSTSNIPLAVIADFHSPRGLGQPGRPPHPDPQWSRPDLGRRADRAPVAETTRAVPALAASIRSGSQARQSTDAVTGPPYCRFRAYPGRPPFGDASAPDGGGSPDCRRSGCCGKRVLRLKDSQDLDLG
jgi:hypothetical protein